MSRPGLTVLAAGSAEAAASLACAAVAEALRGAVAERGLATMALSGGRTPARLVELLAEQALEWGAVHLFQVDERAVADGDADRNWRLMAPLAHRLPAGHAHPMPVSAVDADDAYAAELASVCGSPPVLDVVQLGLGTDGHTASLPPGDPVVDVVDRDVAWSAEYAGHRRLTLTVPALSRARLVVWLVTGAAKASVLRQFVDGDRDLVASRVTALQATLVVDDAAVAWVGG